MTHQRGGNTMQEEKIKSQVIDEEGNCIEETELTKEEVELIKQFREAEENMKAAVLKLLS